MDTYHVIGLMSGSSLDGLDIAYCEFCNEKGKWNFKILKTEIVEYPAEWIQEIKRLPVTSAKTFLEIHTSLGNYFGERVSEFIQKNSLQNKVDLVASHGHNFSFPRKEIYYSNWRWCCYCCPNQFTGGLRFSHSRYC